MDYIEIEQQIIGFCKKVPRKALYRYPATPAMAYRLVRAGYIEWADYPELKKRFDLQVEATQIARKYYDDIKKTSKDRA